MGKGMARGYALATAIYLAALAITLTTPLLRERLTFFAFWPAIFAASWFGGLGPGLFSTAASAVAIALLVGTPQGTLVGPGNLLVPLVAFCVTGAGGALLAHRRQQAEAGLREEESRFRSVADSAPVLIWISDAAERFTYVNRPWLALSTGSLAVDSSSSTATPPLSGR
jgi:PAS domain-containing protein